MLRFFCYQGKCKVCKNTLEELRHSQDYCITCSPFVSYGKTIKPRTKSCTSRRHMDNMVLKGNCEHCGHISTVLMQSLETMV